MGKGQFSILVCRTPLSPYSILFAAHAASLVAGTRLRAFATDVIPRSVQLTARRMESITRTSRDDSETFLEPVSPLAVTWRLDSPAMRRMDNGAVGFFAPSNGQPGDSRDMLPITPPANSQPHTRQSATARAGHHAADAIGCAYARTIYRLEDCLRVPPRPHLTPSCLRTNLNLPRSAPARQWDSGH